MTTPLSTSDPKRLSEEIGEGSLERALLKAGSSYRGSSQMRAHVLAGLGLAGSSALISGSAAAASTATASQFAWTKLLLGVSLFGATAVPVGYYALHRAPPAGSPAAQSIASAPVAPAVAPGEPAAAARSATLSAELGALDHARLVLAGGDGRRALEEIDAYDRAFPVAAALLPAACTTTVDSIGYNGVGGVHLRPLPDHPPPPNKLREAGKTDADIASKIAAIFNSLFYGDPNTQAIYFPMGSDQANIQDILHNREVRTEGIGLGMMIAVELDKRTEFDRLWTYANNVLRYKDPPSAGYFPSSCDTMMATEPCDDPYGMQQMLMALIFAHDRWRSDSGPVDYEAGAVALLDVMRHKQDQNGGIVDGVTDVFDP